MGAQRPILALGGFGGAAYEVLETLRGKRDPAVVSDDDLNLMAQTHWGDQSAKKSVDVLLNQREKRVRIQQQTETLLLERSHRRTLALLSMLGSIFFVLVLMAIAESGQDENLPRWFLYMLFGSPALAGASGALIRVVYDHWRQGVKPRGLQPVIMTTVLGFWASGVAGALFVLPQVLALNGLQRRQANRLLPFAALIGLLAGLTLEISVSQTD